MLDDMNPAGALIAGLAAGLLIGIPIGRHGITAAYNWWAMKYAFAGLARSGGALLGWGLAALLILGGAAWWWTR